LSRRRSEWRRSPPSPDRGTRATLSSGGAPPKLWKLRAPRRRRPFEKPLPQPNSKRARFCPAAAPGGPVAPLPSIDRGTLAALSSGGAQPLLWKFSAPQRRRPFDKPLRHPNSKRVHSCLAAAPGGTGRPLLSQNPRQSRPSRRARLCLSFARPARPGVATLSSNASHTPTENAYALVSPPLLVAPVAPIFLRISDNRDPLVGRGSASALQGRRAPASPPFRRNLPTPQQQTRTLLSHRRSGWHRSPPSSSEPWTIATLSSGGALPQLWKFSAPQRLVAPVALIFLRTPDNRGSLIGRGSASALGGQRSPVSLTLRQALVPSHPEIKRIRPCSGRGFCWHRSLSSDRRTL
jgi:hypothetical protein